jgi:perosamine synthetase
MGRILGTDLGLVPIGRARTGIYLLVRQALKRGRKKVVLSPYTIPDVVNMVVLAGGEPVFADSLPRSTNIDCDALDKLVEEDVACLLLTHYHVNQSEVAFVTSLCARRGVSVFEDCALSLSARIGGRHVGADSDGAILSLSGFKFLNYFWGGCVFSRHRPVVDALRRETERWSRLGRKDYLLPALRTMKYDFATRSPIFDLAVFPLLKLKRSSGAVNLAPPRLESTAFEGSLLSLPSASALAEWNAKLDRLPGFLEHRRWIASIYDEHLREHMVSRETPGEIRDGSCFVNYPIYAGEKWRDRAYRNLLAAGYDVGVSLYPNCHEHSRFSAVPGKSDNVADLVRSVITLPTHPRVGERYARLLARAVAKELGAAGRH